MKNLTTLLISIVFIATFGFGQTNYVPDDNFEQALIDLDYDDTLDDYVLMENIDYNGKNMFKRKWVERWLK